jgi:hypothetical protein
MTTNRPPHCRLIALLAVITAAAVSLTSPAGGKEPEADAVLKAVQEAGAVSIMSADGGRVALRYQVEPLADIGLPVDSACYFHPLSTPAGVVVTDVAPPDHPHHRGIFLGWVEMHGDGGLDGDFWGWGAHAPIKGRRIVNREVKLLPAGEQKDESVAGFVARNEWVAGETVMVNEELRAEARFAEPSAHVLDLTYTLTAPKDLRVARWAFSGFCVRTTREGPEPEAHGPDGMVKLPNPSHVDPSSDWPAAAWYGYTLRPGGADAPPVGVAVIDHPNNPPALWHNHRGVRMLNPCVAAPGELTLNAGQPLVLRYRVVAHDGPTPGELLGRLASEWAEHE